MNSRIAELELNGTIDFTRQRDWFDPSTAKVNLSVIGGGGVGSLFSVMAGKLGINKITLYDHDLVEAHNIPNQFFSLDGIGLTKVDSLASSIENFTVSEVEPRREKVDESTRLSGLVVSGVDSMSARADIAKAVHASRFTVQRYWDARIGGEKLIIFSVDPKNPSEWAAYEKSLYSDDDAASDPCTRRSVIDVMGHVGAHLLTSVRRSIAKEEVPGFLLFNIETLMLTSVDSIEAMYSFEEEAE